VGGVAVSTFEQVLELIQTITPEEKADLREHLSEGEAQKPSLTPRQVGTLASRGKIYMSPDFDEYLGDDFWLGDANDSL